MGFFTINVVIKGRSVIGKQSRGRFNFARAVLAGGRIDLCPFVLVLTICFWQGLVPLCIMLIIHEFQCFDTVGLVSRRASSL